jgi:excinuclease ABC subunit A
MTSLNRDEFATGKPGCIAIRGAWTHNLRGVDVDIPHGSMTVITGVSGSGKSSLVYDTLFAEGQRQYLQSLSAHARQWVTALPRPPLASLEGLPPTLCIDQRPQLVSSRSTVGTVTEIYDFLRLLMARVGTAYCFQCGQPILQQASDEIARDLAQLPGGTRLTVMAPIVRGRVGGHRDVLEAIAKAGLVKARVDGEFLDIEDRPHLVPTKRHTIEAVCDRIVVRPDSAERIQIAVDLALQLAAGLVSIHAILPPQPGAVAGTEIHDRIYSTKYACPDCGVNYAEIEPRIFSFFSPYGACEACHGRGVASVGPGTEAEESREATESAMFEHEEERPCPACDGTRLRRESRSIKLEGLSIDQITAFTIDSALAWLQRLAWQGVSERIAAAIMPGLLQRLEFLQRVGLGYLSLDRSTRTLSGGELQRVRLSSSLGTGLIGVCYILDEPSLGLHPRDCQRLLEVLRALRDQGNTLLVVEHDEGVMRVADRLVDMGPGAGSEGGRVLASGSPSQVAASPESLTGAYLRGEKSIPAPSQRRVAGPGRWLGIRGARGHHLKSLDIDLPLGVLVGVTGVSGSGKSTLILDTLVPVLRRLLTRSTATRQSAPPEGQTSTKRVDEAVVVGRVDWLDSLVAWEQLDQVVVVDQSAMGSSPRSTPATYTGAWDGIREVFAQTREAKQRGYAASRFSFNAGPGRCEACQGQGATRLRMGFLGDAFVPCSHCQGSRFNPPTLSIRYKGKNIADVLQMSVSEAAEYFANFAKISAILHSLDQVGLGYLRLGQPSQSLSGGEAQRIQLATALARPATGRTLYVLDEPTSGLHFQDIAHLLVALQGLVDRGNTVLVIEHQLDVIQACDWLIDLGPEGGPQGGYLMAAGTPEVVAACPTSVTGRCLAERFCAG